MGKYYLCIVYVSEALKPSTIESLVQIATNTYEKRFVHKFQDIVYNRTSFYFIGQEEIINCALNVCNKALELIDFSKHTGTHPCLGTVDNICFSPLGNESTLQETAEMAMSFSKQFFETKNMPIFMYGKASPKNSSLRDIRHSLGYFNESNSILEHEKPIPDFGTISSDYTHGISCVGAVPFILNYNVRFRPQDSKEKVLRVTKLIRNANVQALTLLHDSGSYEVACNLLTPSIYTKEMVLENALPLIQELGLEIVDAYTTGPTEVELMALAENLPTL